MYVHIYKMCAVVHAQWRTNDNKMANEMHALVSKVEVHNIVHYNPSALTIGRNFTWKELSFVAKSTHILKNPPTFSVFGVIENKQ